MILKHTFYLILGKIHVNFDLFSHKITLNFISFFTIIENCKNNSRTARRKSITMEESYKEIVSRGQDFLSRKFLSFHDAHKTGNLYVQEKDNNRPYSNVQGGSTMKILVISDEESKYLWDYFEKSKLENIDLIISCGDLAPQYLSFLATFTHAPVLYVHGNHDECYNDTPPDGCICIDDEVFTFQGIRILGLGGSMRYKEGRYLFTERQMERRIRKLRFKLWRSKGFDILVTHAPAYHLNDSQDLPHMGFQSFLTLLDKYQPKYFLHGHVHATYGDDFKRLSSYHTTTIINGYERYEFEYI